MAWCCRPPAEASGEYTFSPVRIGNYSISATCPGLRYHDPERSETSACSSVVVNLQLKPGSTSETVEVSAAAPLMQTEDASVGQVVDGHTDQQSWP